MKIETRILVNGGIQIVDAEDDDSPLAILSLQNESAKLDEAARLRLGERMRIALVEELLFAGIVK